MKQMTRKMTLVAALAVSLSACSNATIEKAETNPLPHDMTKGEGLFSGKSGNLLDIFRDDDKDEAPSVARIGVNGYLWRSTLETLDFLPISSADSAGGVVLTDWYNNPEKPGERVKVNVYILGTTLRPQNLKVALFKQVKSESGWSDVAGSQTTAAQLEETILTGARRLKVKEQAAQ